jgi:hypothetical protein
MASAVSGGGQEPVYTTQLMPAAALASAIHTFLTNHQLGRGGGGAGAGVAMRTVFFSRMAAPLLIDDMWLEVWHWVADGVLDVAGPATGRWRELPQERVKNHPLWPTFASSSIAHVETALLWLYTVAPLLRRLLRVSHVCRAWRARMPWARLAVVFNTWLQHLDYRRYVVALGVPRHGATAVLAGDTFSAEFYRLALVHVLGHSHSPVRYPVLLSQVPRAIFGPMHRERAEHYEAWKRRTRVDWSKRPRRHVADNKH